ncbi:MAG: hypothetical protein ACTTKH_07760 [Treponema sp.]
MKKKLLSLFIMFSCVAFIFMACQRVNSAGGGVDDDDENQDNGGANTTVLDDSSGAFSNPKPISAKFTITPKNDEATYAFGIMTKEKYDEALEKSRKLGQDPTLGIFHHDVSWNKYLQSQYNGSTWQEISKKAGYYKKGKQEVENIVSSGYINIADIRPGSTCIAYWYLIKETSEKPDSKIFTKEYVLPKNTPSQNSLTLTTTKTYSNGVADVKVTTTNEDPYVVLFVIKKNYEFYTTGAGKGKYTLTDFVHKKISDEEVSGEKKVKIFSGTNTLDHSAFDAPSGDVKEGCVILYCVFDKDNGVRSEVKALEFTPGNNAP